MTQVNTTETQDTVEALDAQVKDNYADCVESGLDSANHKSGLLYTGYIELRSKLTNAEFIKYSLLDKVDQTKPKFAISQKPIDIIDRRVKETVDKPKSLEVNL